MIGDELARAETLVQLGRTAEAQQLAARFLATHPDHVRALRVFVRASIALGDPSGLAAAQRAVALAPGDEEALELAALAAAVRRRMKLARSYADAALAMSPGSYDANLTRAWIEDFGVWPDKRGLACAQEAVRLSPAEAQAHHLLGNRLVAHGRTREARQSQREALRLDPDDGGARNELARLDLKAQRLGPAAAGFAAVAAADPTDDRALHNLVVTAGKYVRIVHLLLLVICLFLLGDRFGDLGHRIAATVGIAVVVLAVTQIVRRVRRYLPGRAGRLVRLVLRRDRLLVAWVVFLAVGFSGLVAVVVQPGSVVWRVVVVLAVVLFAGLIRLVRGVSVRSSVRQIH